MGLIATEKTVRSFVADVSDQRYPLTSVVIAASAAQAVALGEACIQISLENQIDKLDWADVTARIGHMANIKKTLLKQCDQEAHVIDEYVSWQSDSAIDNHQIFWEGPAEISRLSIAATKLLQDFRPFVFKQIQDDLEITINLLVGTARAAMLLLDSNLRLGTNQALLEKYEPLRAQLEEQIAQLTPLSRFRA